RRRRHAVHCRADRGLLVPGSRDSERRQIRRGGRDVDPGVCIPDDGRPLGTQAMRFDQVTVPLVPRSTANCLDLALCFTRHFLKPIAALWATFALPSCILVYILVDRYEFKF